MIGALTLDAGIGISQGVVVADGMWVQSALPHTSNLTSPAWRLGFTIDGGKWDLGAHYVQNGVDHIDAYATTDANYDRYRHRCVSACGKLDHFVGTGSANGISLTLDRHISRWSVGVGAYLFQPYWVEVINGTRYTNDKTAWHIGPSASLSYRKGAWSVRLEDALTCVANRCKTERTPGPWGSIATLTLNYSWR